MHQYLLLCFSGILIQYDLKTSITSPFRSISKTNYTNIKYSVYLIVHYYNEECGICPTGTLLIGFGGIRNKSQRRTRPSRLIIHKRTGKYPQWNTSPSIEWETLWVINDQDENGCRIRWRNKRTRSCTFGTYYITFMQQRYFQRQKIK